MARNLTAFVCLSVVAICGRGLSARAGEFSRLVQSPSSAPSTNVQYLFNDGQASLQRGDLDRAEADFRKVLRANPDLAGAWANLGVIAMRRKSR